MQTIGTSASNSSQACSCSPSTRKKWRSTTCARRSAANWLTRSLRPTALDRSSPGGPLAAPDRRASSAFVRELTAVRVPALPEDPAWQYEAKWDGYRAIAVKRADIVTLYSRRRNVLTGKYPAIVKRDSKYVPGQRGLTWFKHRIGLGQPLVIGGFVRGNPLVELHHRRLVIVARSDGEFDFG